jgi:hypothetical protein
LAGQPFDPANQPLESIGTQPMEPAATLEPPIAESVAALPPAADLPPLPPLPPMPPLPTHNDPVQPTDGGLPPLTPGQGPLPPASQNDPGQFRIPGQ